MKNHTKDEESVYIFKLSGRVGKKKSYFILVYWGYLRNKKRKKGNIYIRKKKKSYI